MSILSLPMPNLSDQSVMMLDQILGSNFVGSIVNGSAGLSATSIFPEMMAKYNALLLSFGLIIVAIMLFVGTMNTSASGEFLGREWNGIWTVFRLFIGILCIVPLSTGYCLGQYIFMYIILIGINLGTSLWNTIVDDAFTKYSPPAIPSYMVNYTLEMLEQNVVTDMLSYYFSLNNTAGASETINLPPGYTMSMGKIPAVIAPQVVNMISQPAQVYGSDDNGNTTNPAYFGGQWGSGCYALYNSAAAITACLNTLTTALSTPSNTGIFSWGNGSNQSMFINVSSVAPHSMPNASLLANPTSFARNTWSGGGADGKMSVSGSYTITTSSGQFTTNTVVAQDTAANAAFQKALGIQAKIPVGSSQSAQSASAPPRTQDTGLLATYETNYFNTKTGQTIITPFWAIPTNANKVPTPQQMAPFSLLPIANAAIADAMQTINASGGDPGAPSNQFGHCNQTDAEGNPVCGLEEGPDGSYSFEIQGMPYIDNNGETAYGQTINVPLSGSWWNAGESYLILDAQFAANLQDLAQIIASNMAPMNSSLKLTGSIQFSFYLAMAEYGSLWGADTTYHNDLFNSAQYAASTVIEYPAPSSSGIQYPDNGTAGSLTKLQPTVYMGNAGQAMGYVANYVNVNLPGALDLTSLFFPASDGTQAAWETAIAPFDPNAASDFPALYTPGTTADLPCPVAPSTPGLGNLFQALQAVSPYYQTSLRMLLQYAANQSDCSGAKGVTLQTLVQPLQNLMFMMNENGLIANQTNGEELPVNQAMSSIFSQLLGNANVTGVSAGVSPVGLNSVMQDVYNLGMDTQTSGVSGQFSLIQEVRTAGIEMIAACISSMQSVYEQYEQINTAMIGQLNQDTADATDASKQIEEYSWIPFGGGSVATAVASVEVQNDMLKMQVLTLTTMTQVTLQLMWMPVFLFVMTSLFSAGVEFALVIPFMPYMMFWGGQVAWLLGVLEALVAAPLVMLGIAHPGGNQYLGHGQGAVRLLIGVVFRPVLMVIGMTVGILLTYVLINFSAQGFHIVADNTFNALPVGNQALAGVMGCILLFSYCSFLMMAFTKCFSPIYSIPEGVVRWIGGEAAAGGKEEAQQFGQAAKSSGDKAAQAGGEALQKGVAAQEKRGENASQMDQKRAQTSFDNAQSVGRAESDVSKNAVKIAQAAAGGGD